MSHVHVLQHPLVSHHLCQLRDKRTRPPEFRSAVSRLAMLIGVRATDDLPTQPVTIPTPVADAPCHELAADIGIVPVLRAGLGMVDPLLDLIPDASVWHLGLYRNEQTAEPVGYYDKLPKKGAPNVALILDPMLATGGSIDMVVRRLMRWGVEDIRVLSIIASQAGLDRVAKDFPHVKLFVAAVDPSLNEQAFIVPGLGDAGDRIFDTPQND
ncbi:MULTISPECIES: uracil phosphoribosyltransferase [Rhodopirellula]|uniref:Uracil phosphoribosyltransferase n=2 Tax=Rhodopirellula europaea TaxID=1263866 RepID=M2B991_9BACT|nr:MULTISPECIES: uracil phosphoribosyltransferase [Rhodopirellula]EMB18273.1 uracil phosphoribosyltransferase [Rhodopirellula europaea 6C]EMI27390.1 uracil phosphoribosyltransferase [Rhodopirellula europaea SH398]MCR9208457.1 uracil phosphoribosyltransferase [bacterium]